MMTPCALLSPSVVVVVVMLERRWSGICHVFFPVECNTSSREMMIQEVMERRVREYEDEKRG